MVNRSDAHNISLQLNFTKELKLMGLFIMQAFTDPVFYVQAVAVTILSICLHELGHGFAALSQGDDTPSRSGHITMNPVVHMGVPSLVILMVIGIAWGQMPVNPSRFRSRQWSDFLVSIAGPLTNLALTALFVAALVAKIPFLSTTFLRYGAIINASLFLLNMIPIPPLDGFNVFSKFFPGLHFFNSSQGQQYSQGLLMLLFIVGGKFLTAGAFVIVGWMMGFFGEIIRV
jgi:Zn-dependent protease